MYCAIGSAAVPTVELEFQQQKFKFVRQTKCGIIAYDDSVTMRDESEYFKMILYEHSQYEISIAIHKEDPVIILNVGHGTLYSSTVLGELTVYSTRLGWIRENREIIRMTECSSHSLAGGEWTMTYFMPTCQCPIAPVVPYAVFLSGGARSIGVAARLARQHLEHESTALVAYVAGYDDADFVPARIAAERLRLDLREVWMHPHIDIECAVEQAETWGPQLLRRHLLYQLGLAAKRDGFNVVFTGHTYKVKRRSFEAMDSVDLRSSTLQVRCAGERVPTIMFPFGLSMLEEQRRRRTLRGETWPRDIYQSIFDSE